MLSKEAFVASKACGSVDWKTIRQLPKMYAQAKRHRWLENQVSVLPQKTDRTTSTVSSLNGAILFLNKAEYSVEP
jgi:hypothetical protein